MFVGFIIKNSERRKENKMKKTIMTTIILGMFLLSLASAYDINLKGGTCMNESLTLSDNYDKYEITDNITSMNGLSVSKVNDTNNVLICADFLTEGYFTITFYNWREEIIDSGSSGGGGICYRKYKITDWNECINNKQTRKLDGYNYTTCYQIKQDKPILEQECNIIIEDNQEDSEPIIKQEEKKINYLLWIIVGIISIIIISLIIYKITE